MKGCSLVNWYFGLPAHSPNGSIILSCEPTFLALKIELFLKNLQPCINLLLFTLELL